MTNLTDVLAVEPTDWQKSSAKSLLSRAYVATTHRSTLDSQSEGYVQQSVNSTTSKPLVLPLDLPRKTLTYRCKDGRTITRSVGRKAPRLNSRLLNIKQAAEYLNVSVWKMRQLVAMGRIEPSQFSSNTSPMYFTREALDRFIETLN